jgi:iron complex outermembrane receptor protein
MKSMTTYRRVSTIMAVLMAIGVSDGASAQQSATATQLADADAADQASGTGKAAGLTEIIVTADRRRETLQEAPLTVTAVSADAAQNLDIRNLETVQFISPNLSFSGQVDYAQVYIRGVGTNYANPGLENSVAFYQDDVYLTSPDSILHVLDPASIQVLNGPQGTLYGRNASGGVVLLNSANPTDKEEGTVSVEAGRFDHEQGELMLNEPISDELKLRIAARYLNDGGYITNDYNGQKLGGETNYTARVKLDWTPAAVPGLDVLLAGEYGYSHQLHDFESERFYAPNCLGCLLGASPAEGFYNTDQNSAFAFRNEYRFVNLHVTYDLGDFTLKNVVAFRKQDFDSPGGSDQDYTTKNLFAFGSATAGHTYTEDFTLQSNFQGPFNFISGLSYMRDVRSFNSSFYGSTFSGIAAELASFGLPVAPGTPPTNYSGVRTDSGSGFLEASYKPIEDLTLTAGGRYNVDHRVLDTQNNIVAEAVFGNAGIREHTTYYSFTPKFVASYKTDYGNVYISDTRGFKSGGVNTPAFVADPIVSPEKNHSEEIGLKSKWLDGRLQTSIDAFHYKDVGLQVQVTDVLAGGDVTENAASAEGTGVEASGTYAVNDNLTVGAGGDYLHARFVSYKAGALYCQTPAGLVGCSYDISGSVLPHAPSFTAYATADYTQPIFDGFNANIDVLAHWTDQFEFIYGGAGPQQFARQTNYWVVNINAYVTPDDEQYRIGVYIDNATNAKYNDFATVAGPYGAYSQAAPPLSFGVKLEYKFGNWSGSAAAPPPAAPAPPPEPTPAPPPAAPAPEPERAFQVFFDFDKSDITGAAAAVIQQAADTIKSGRFTAIKVTGHTDTVGTAAYNLALSQRRAAAVQKQLVADGIPAADIATVGVGKSGLLVPTGDQVREPQNRRAEIRL